MMKFANSDTTTMSLRHGEQYENCSELLIEPGMTSLEELDPAILSCGLPAIVLNEEDLATSTTTATATQNPIHPSSLMGSFNVAAATAANVIRYTVAHLLALRKSPFSHRRPAAIDDPRTGQYPIWSRTGFTQQQDTRVRRASRGGSDDEHLAYGRKPNDRQRDNGFNPPRFRRNHEFSNRNHHVIVKSYNTGDPSGHGSAMRLQDTIIEEEPEWVVGGPTSRLDTIELRGFDEDVSRTVSESLKASPPCGKQRGAFFDELLHYEHVHPKHHGGAKHDTSGSAGEGESVSTSNNGSPPPARSTPTKSGPADMNHNGGGHGRKLSGMAAGCSSSGGGGGVNVSNFEELMKFDSILGDSGDSSSSRFSKYYHRGNGGVASGSGIGGQHHYQNHHSQHSQHHVRFALERNTHHYNSAPSQHQNRQAGSGRLPISALQHPPAGVESYQPGASGSSGLPTTGDAKSFQRLLEMLAAQNQRNYQQQQQQYLLQLLQNCQETETLRQMLLKKCSLENAATNQPGGQQQSQRIPTQAELQQHTQTIMKQALLRKKIAEQSRYMLEQRNGQEAIPAVQQLIQSICPNAQRSLSVLAGNNGPEGRNDLGAVGGGTMFAGANRGGQMRHSNRRY
ncbi:protein cup-like [Anopheles maculipalpis]|uniref:protein cup-like n=1 Tax=Anopheles maculipalpis TaxID=1496333 RepID=UPI002158DF77|nr:protein cup-like [Anopheles maculipalpis]